MLNQDEVASIMKNEIPKLLQARIDELELALIDTTKMIDYNAFGDDAFSRFKLNNSLINKGVSL